MALILDDDSKRNAYRATGKRMLKRIRKFAEPKFSIAEMRAALSVAEKNYRKYGSVTPPREVLYQNLSAECPKCDHAGPILADFGLRTRTNDGEIVPHSWCKKCRSRSAVESNRRRRANEKKRAKKK